MANWLVKGTKGCSPVSDITCGRAGAMSTEIAYQPRGSGDVCECGHHRNRCLFGHEHSWGTWYEDGKLMRTRQTFQCWVCGGICTLEEDDA